MAELVIAIVTSPTDLRVIQDGLSPERIEVQPASSTEEAVAHLASGQALVILYDTDAPHQWGEALRTFLEAQPSARVVLLSRLADEGMWIEVLDRGGYDLLMKPFLAAELRAVVRSALAPIRLLRSTAA